MNNVDLPVCTRCRLQHDPATECPKLRPWKERPARTLGPAPDHYDPDVIPTFNPTCKHDRCCYTLSNCDACIRYTKDLWEARAQAKNAVDVVPRK